MGLGGLVGLSLADTVIFPGQGGFSGTTVAVAMFGVFILGALAFIPRFSLNKNKICLESKACLAGIFLTLLLPFAILV